MADGLLAASSPAANVDVLVYTCPADRVATVDVTIRNRTAATTTTVDLAVTDGAAPGASSWIDHADLPVGWLLIRDRIPLGPGQRVYVRASAAGVVVQVFGYEETV